MEPKRLAPDFETLVPGFGPALAAAPGTLSAYRQLRKVLEKGVLSARVRAQIGLLTAGRIRCEYSVWAYGCVARAAGLDAEAILLAGVGSAIAPREAAILRLANRMMQGGVLLRRVDCEVEDAILLGDQAIREIAPQLAYAILTCRVLQRVAPRTGVSAQARKA